MVLEYASECKVAFLNLILYVQLDREKRVFFCRSRLHLFRVCFAEQCVGSLGMESERISDEQIRASSSYDSPSVGPQNAR